MTHDETFGEAVASTFGAGSSSYTNKVKQKLDEEEQARKVAEELKKHGR